MKYNQFVNDIFITNVVVRHFVIQHDISFSQPGIKKAPVKGLCSCACDAQKIPLRLLYAVVRGNVKALLYQSELLVIGNCQVDHHAVAGSSFGALELEKRVIDRARNRACGAVLILGNQVFFLSQVCEK